MSLAPKVATLASLCSRASRASSPDHSGAARTPAILFAAIAMPTPVPHIKTPRSARPSHFTRHALRVIRIVGGFRRIGSEIHHLVAFRRELLPQLFLECKSRVVRAD